MWELRLPIVWGIFIPTVERALSGKINTVGSASKINACNQLTDITNARLQQFSDADLDEVYGIFVVGMEVRNAFDRFIGSNHFFRESQSDWVTAVMHMTRQRPNYGQARWASLQLAEKFMKGLIMEIGDVSPIPHTHTLSKLHDELAASFLRLDLGHLLQDIQCSAAVRYGEEPSSLQQAYAAHKSSLLLVKALGTVRNANDQS